MQLLRTHARTYVGTRTCGRSPLSSNTRTPAQERLACLRTGTRAPACGGVWRMQLSAAVCVRTELCVGYKRLCVILFAPLCVCLLAPLSAFGSTRGADTRPSLCGAQVQQLEEKYHHAAAAIGENSSDVSTLRLVCEHCRFELTRSA
eukprot:2652861-Pleurochrysis_carterae.AAC.1